MGTEDHDFTTFVRVQSPALMRVVFLLTGDRGLAEDLLQTSLQKASRRWPAIEDPRSAYAYMRRALANTTLLSFSCPALAGRLDSQSCPN